MAKKATPKPRKRTPKRNPPNPFDLGNELWKLRGRSGAKPKYESPAELYQVVLEYFEHVRDNPFKEQRVASANGMPTIVEVDKMRPFTQHGLCNWLCIDRKTWVAWRENRADLLPIITWADSVIYDQKFEGAASGFLNASIISRDLGLVDRREEERHSVEKIELQFVDRKDDED